MGAYNSGRATYPVTNPSRNGSGRYKTRTCDLHDVNVAL